MVYVILWVVCSWGCACLLSVMALRAATSKVPVGFYPKMELTCEMLTSVPLYNKENCQMWISYSFFFWINGLVGIFDRPFGAVVLALCIVPGLPLLVRRYNHILRKYVILSDQESKNSREEIS